MRSLRSLAVAHQLGHVLMGEQDEKISLLQRLIEHALNTARYNIYYGEGRDAYDVRGRTAHESDLQRQRRQSIRCPNSQQGYSPFSTWTRGLAWAILGFAEQLEFLSDARAAEVTSCRTPSGRSRRAHASACLRRRQLATTVPRGRHAPPPISISPTPAPTASRCGTPARRTCIAWANYLEQACRPVQPHGSRWTVPPPPSPRRA